MLSIAPGLWLGLLWVICTQFGLDRRNTLHLALLAFALWVLLPVLSAIIYLLFYFGEHADNSNAISSAILERKNFSRWVGIGLVSALGLSALAAFFSYPVVTMLPQYCGGATRTVSATAIDVDTSVAGRAICKARIYLRFADNSTGDVCARTGGLVSTYLIDFTPRAGDHLLVTLRENLLGSSIQRITGIDP
jgi:hypothetical protein